MYPQIRLRRLRQNKLLRDLVQENHIHLSDLIYPLFVIPGKNISKPISSMPGVSQMSIDVIIKEIKEILSLGIKSILLFGIPETKDEIGSSSWSDSGIIQQAVKAIRDAQLDVTIITDLCFCEYTSHGHCGVMCGEHLDNDATLINLSKQAISHAKVGVDIIAPSGMMDGMVKSLRNALDSEGFTNLPIMSYATKYASSFYGPFREAAECSPQFGDRKTYQMNPANIREAIREAELDLQEGADILMVKPGMPYLDVIRELRNRFNTPIAVYQVSGEYAMIKAASQHGWLDHDRVMIESLMSFKRAGSDMIITYFAKDYAKLING